MSISVQCTKCGSPLSCWLTESGDYVVAEPCVNKCSNDLPNKFETDEDFEENECH